MVTIIIILCVALREQQEKEGDPVFLQTTRIECHLYYVKHV